MNKPNTSDAMKSLIEQIRKTLPFHLSKEQLCSGCNRHGCAFKLLEYVDSELCDWERRLDSGEVPNFGDIQKLSKVGKKIHKTLQKIGNLVTEE